MERAEGILMYAAMYTALCMTTKNLAIRENVYQKLAEAKRQGESFSDVIERVLEKRGSLLPLWGALVDSDTLAEIEGELRKIRKRASIRV
jgi:predicted CopG family antitoxin